MHQYPGLQQDLVANQTSRHIDKYSRASQPRFNIEDDERKSSDDSDNLIDKLDPIKLANEYIYTVNFNEKGTLCIQVNERIADSYNQDELMELSSHYSTLVSEYVQQDGPQAQIMMDTLEPPTYKEANKPGFNLRDHYDKKQDQLEHSVQAFEQHKLQEEKRIKSMR